jgi:hypothetical protein
MSSLWVNPVIQSVIVPFVVSLVVALLLRPHGWVWAGLSAVAGFAATVYLITDFQFFPLRSERKILLLGAGALLLGLLLDILPRQQRLISPVLFIAAASAALWLAWPRFRFVEGVELWVMVVGGAAYVGWMVVSFEGLRQRPVLADSACLSLGLGTGLAALLGATALYSQLALAIAAAVGARWLLSFLNRPVVAGSVMLVPLVLVLAMLGFGAVIYAKLPWYSLLLLSLIPLLARVPLPGGQSGWKYNFLALVIVLVPTVLVIYLVWVKVGAPPI